MAFKTVRKKTKTEKDIESLFRDLKTNGVESLYSHQADILRNYQLEPFNDPNVAIELPTGSGKTLIGLLIAEHKRQTLNQKVLYICPTRQLVNQVAEMAENTYGIKAIPFIGSKKSYSAEDKTSYNNAEAIAITTYSSLFNVKPYFVDPDLIVIDDAHASENYIASNWSFQVVRNKHTELYKSLINFFGTVLEDNITHQRLQDDNIDPLDKKHIYTFPNYAYFNHKSEFSKIIDARIEETDLRYTWNLIKNNLHACNIFYSWGEILIRPLIPPSLTNESFAKAKQRLFMSATLGNGGDLERITGIKNITRIPIPKGWDKQGLGRRFFQFPGIQLEEEEVKNYVLQAIQKSPRTVFLVSSNNDVEKMEELIDSKTTGFELFSATDIEKSKTDFINSEKAVTIMANRFDGIDFPSSDCRLLIIKDIPYHANIQEKFLQSKIDASAIFYDRNRTRLIQAIGRCTRSPKDYSAVIVIGEQDLTEWLFYADKHKYFHPELQSELKFGFENSRADQSELLENLSHFLNQDEVWEDANRSIIEHRNEIKVSPIEGMDQLDNSIKSEIDYIYHLWNADYENALKSCNQVIDNLAGGKVLQGYRAFWNYLKCNLCYQIYKSTGDDQLMKLSRETFEKASRISSAFRSVKLSEQTDVTYQYSENFDYNIDRILEFFNSKQFANSIKFNRYLDSVITLLEDPTKIEEAQVEIGNLLGFNTINSDDQGAPDPIWISNQNLIFVFEDKLYENDEKLIPLKDIRQVTTHKSWIDNKVEHLAPTKQVYSIFLSNSLKVDERLDFAYDQLYYWNWNNFVQWSLKLVRFIQNLQVKFTKDQDESWKSFVQKAYYEGDFTPEKIIDQLKLIKSIL